MLKDMGFNIATIKEIVESENIEVIKSQFENRSAQIKEEMDDLKKTITSPRRLNENDERGCY